MTTKTIDKDQLEEGRGRLARKPLGIPLAGWGDILLRFWRGFNNDNLVLVAAGLAYFTLLAIFPSVILFVSLYGIFADPLTAADHASGLAGVLPPLAAEFILSEITRVAEADHGGLSLVSLVSFVIIVFGAGRAARATFQALNVAYGERERRNLLQINILALAFTLGFILAGVVALTLVVAFPALISALSLPLKAESAIVFLRWPMLFFGMIVATSILYRYGPCRAEAQLQWLSLGSVAASLLWVLSSLLISFYASKITDFSATYGAFGAVLLLQMWLWATALMVLVGAKINAEAEHQTAYDTTTGPEQPIGERGAVVADELGPTRHQGAAPVEVPLSEAE
ncbi:YihY/virulence factor BrkB family protein [Parvularcula sp. ZS-1/3]|uniref:YihY/virulence factor BrkB family protein n=1 Tax=Parvularcula mediterranea TaxID=2732508 RepID=A0A7Y3W5T4_9PROT|nr:YihY/virulence factor BrkB family protein [Parvularcula mediterranea]NNU16596.1 YihY/virulence factor BrkB family protein [Parvularcula mediterranea]